MKKTILALAIIFAATFSFAQTSYQFRFANANRDSIRTQIRMAVIDIATDRVDTATNQSRRFCMDVLSQPTASYWVDYFSYQIASIISIATPTDANIRTQVAALWDRVSLINARR